MGENKGDPPKIRQYKSRPEGFSVNSWIIETEMSIVLIDCQFLLSEVTALIEKLQEIDKPVEALFITHPHPDHFNGAGVIHKSFPEVRIIATEKTAQGIKKSDGPKREFWTPIYKSNYPEFTKYPAEELTSGRKTSISGVEFVMEDIGPGECENLSTIHLPQENILFSSDLIYNRVHPWLAEGRSLPWLAQLTSALTKYKNVRRVFPGHGDETTLAGFNAMTVYISRFQQLLRTHSSDEEVSVRMKEEFKSFPLETLLGHNVPAIRAELHG